MPQPAIPVHAPSLPLSERNAIAEKTLPGRFDALNEAILEAEEHLRSFKPIDSIWLNYDIESAHDQPDTVYSIAFAKHKGKWRIVHCVNDGYDPECNVYPLTDCPIERRVRAAAYIPRLHEMIVESKEEFIVKVNETISLLKSLTKKS